MNDKGKASFIHWASHCLVGHMAYFQILLALPLFLVSLIDDHNEYIALTATRVIGTLFGAIAAGLFVAILGWYTVTKPLTQRRGRNDHDI